MSRIKLILLVLIITSCSVPGFEKHGENNSQHKREVLHQTDSLIKVTDQTLYAKEGRVEIKNKIIDSLNKELKQYQLLIDDLTNLYDIEIKALKYKLKHKDTVFIYDTIYINPPTDTLINN